jgi:hypothetical protein
MIGPWRSPLALLLAFGAAPAVAQAAGPQPSWAAELHAKHAGDIAILCGAKGVAAQAGATLVPLTQTPARWCHMDTHGDVVWFGDDTRTLWALDLLAKGAPVKVATGVIERVNVAWGAPHQAASMRVPFENDTHNMQLRVDTQTITTYPGNFDYNLPEGTIARDQAGTKVVGATFLRAVAKRAAAKPVAPAPASPCKDGRAVPGLKPTLEGCEDPELCGKIQGGISGTPLCAVLVRHSCGDGCYNVSAWYNAKTKRFDSLGGLLTGYDPATDTVKDGRVTPGTITASPSGTQLMMDGAIYGLDGAQTHAGWGAGPAGFLPNASGPDALYTAAMATLAGCQMGEHEHLACAKPGYAQLRAAAEAGHRDAQYTLGSRRFSMRFQNEGPNAKSAADRAAYVDALTWLARAAHAGHPKAATYLPPDVMSALLTGAAPEALSGPFGALPIEWVLAAAKASKP